MLELGSSVRWEIIETCVKFFVIAEKLVLRLENALAPFFRGCSAEKEGTNEGAAANSWRRASCFRCTSCILPSVGVHRFILAIRRAHGQEHWFFQNFRACTLFCATQMHAGLFSPHSCFAFS